MVQMSVKQQAVETLCRSDHCYTAQNFVTIVHFDIRI